MTDAANDTTEDTQTEENTSQEEVQNDSIVDLFDDDASEPEKAEEESEKGETETEDSSDDSEESEDTSQKDESEESESEPPSDEEGSVPKRALLDERRKRQQLEEELQKLQQTETEEEAPDPSEDPEAYEKYVEDKVARKFWQETANKSRKKMMESVTDYEELESHFLYLAQTKPELAQEMRDSPDPARFAYTKAKEDLETKEKAVEERVMERLRKEGKLKETRKDSGKGKSAAEVPDLTNAAGAGNNNVEKERDFDTVSDVFEENPLKY